MPDASVVLTQFVQRRRHSCGAPAFRASPWCWCTSGWCCDALTATISVLEGGIARKSQRAAVTTLAQ